MDLTTALTNAARQAIEDEITKIEKAIQRIVKSRSAWADHPNHAFHDKLVAYYAPRIAEAIRNSVSGIPKAIAAASKVVNKAAEDSDAAENAVTSSVKINTDQLKSVIMQMYGDAGLAGSHVASQQGAGTVMSDLADADAAIDWSKWTPGYAKAADLVQSAGLSSILDNLNITLQGITDSAMSRISNALADGLAAGDSVDVIGDSISDVIADDGRADVIANTETARAMSMASMNTYAENGIAQFEWLAEDDACPECEDNADGSPYDVGDDPTVPQHPNCRCAYSPIVNTSSDDASDDGS